MEEKEKAWQEFWDSTVNNFIPLHFKGMSYNAVIDFVEDVLSKLKEDSKTQTRIKGLFDS